MSTATITFIDEGGKVDVVLKFGGETACPKSAAHHMAVEVMAYLMNKQGRSTDELEIEHETL